MKHILIVDDNKTNLIAAKQELSEEYQVTPVISGMQAIQFLEKKHTDLILLDINMPEMDGRETMRRIREREEWSKIPIIFLTADSSPETESQCLADGADDFIAKPFIPRVMKSRISRIIELNSLRNDLEERLAEKTREVQLLTINSMTAITKAIEAKDVYTSGHSERVARCSVEIAKRLGWDEERIENLNYMALLHDIGKIGVADDILNKPSKLTDEEFDIMKSHTKIGANILKEFHTIKNIQYGALYHHEKYDGTGYPDNLIGSSLPQEARIISIADTYDAMNTDRAYRKRMSKEEILAEFRDKKGTQFDPEITDVFIDMINSGFGC